MVVGSSASPFLMIRPPKMVTMFRSDLRMSDASRGKLKNVSSMTCVDKTHFVSDWFGFNQKGKSY